MKPRPHIAYRQWLVAMIVLPLFGSGCQTDQASRPNAESIVSTSNPVVFERDLPVAGTQMPLLPPGEARALAQSNCLVCHSSDMILQQKLTEKQWVAEVDKMQRWGTTIRDDEKPALVAYLASHFGPNNDRFRPIVTRPARSPSDLVPGQVPASLANRPD